jgi:hypothetical protein
MATAKSALIIFRVLQASHSHLQRNIQRHATTISVLTCCSLLLLMRCRC